MLCDCYGWLSGLIDIPVSPKQGKCFLPSLFDTSGKPVLLNESVYTRDLLLLANLFNLEGIFSKEVNDNSLYEGKRGEYE